MTSSDKVTPGTDEGKAPYLGPCTCYGVCQPPCVVHPDPTPLQAEGKVTDPALTQPWRLRKSIVSNDSWLERPDRRDASGFSMVMSFGPAQTHVGEFMVQAINEKIARAAK